MPGSAPARKLNLPHIIPYGVRLFSFLLYEKLRKAELINATILISAEKHGVPDRKMLEKRKKARYIISNEPRSVPDSNSKKAHSSNLISILNPKQR